MKNRAYPTAITSLLFTLATLAFSANAATTFLWNVASPGANNWNVNANWTPATGNPGSADTAVFGATGTAANATTVNNVVSVSTTVTALEYTNTTAGTWHVTQIADGVTLSTSGNVIVGTGLLLPPADSQTVSAA